MIGIFDEGFIEYLRFHLGENSVKINNKNIICRCPWCEMDDEKEHYHLYISTELPIFHCFHAGCPKSSGSIKQLVKKISGGTQILSNVHYDQIDDSNFKLKRKNDLSVRKLVLPEITKHFADKLFYLRQRIGFSNYPVENIKGLILDVEKFIYMNNINLDNRQIDLLPFLQNNFIGFISEHHSVITFRNIDPSSDFRHYKMKLFEPILLDYYKIDGNSSGKKVVLAEGVFDILNEFLFDNLNLKHDIMFYVCGYTTSYKALLKSIAFYENIYKPEAIILSDADVKNWYYKNLKKHNKHLFSTMKVFYNKIGKDFGELKCEPQLIF